MPKRNAKQTKPAAANDEAEEYEVECLLEQRASDGKYKVKWLGYAVEDSTWEPEENIGAWHLAEFKKSHTQAHIRCAAVSAP
eukprot:COSAG01_NODE_13671_length_1550_cov_10.459683_2_plen_82_part_00